jgi:hypothetical protein
VPEVHACTFDYRKAHRELLEKKNPKVEAKKVETI